MESIGKILKAARERKNISVADVATAIKAKRGFVNAIETDRFNDLIAPVYAKGFIKLYAEYVGLDPRPLLQLYNEAQNGNGLAAAPTAPPASSPESAPAPAACQQAPAPSTTPPPAKAPPPPPRTPEKVSPINWRALLPQWDCAGLWRAARERITLFVSNLSLPRSGLRRLMLRLRYHAAGPQLRLLAGVLLGGAVLLAVAAGLWQRHAERCANYAPPSHSGILVEPPEPYPE